MAPKKNTMLDHDPVDWTVDEVVAFFCVKKAPEWGSTIPIQPNTIEQCMRANGISGSVLLNLVNNTVLREDLNVKAFADRAFIVAGIEWLKKRSHSFSSQETQEAEEAEEAPEAQKVQEAGKYPPAKNISKTPRRIKPILVTENADSEPILPNKIVSMTDDHPLIARIMRKYPPKPEDDPDVVTALDSDESSDDEESDHHGQEEAEEETPPPSSSTILSSEELSSEIDDYIEERRVIWGRGLAENANREFTMWVQRDDGAFQKSMEDKLKHFKARLDSIRSALQGAQHTSRSSVRRACVVLDYTLPVMFELEWQKVVMGGSHFPGTNPRDQHDAFSDLQDDKIESNPEGNPDQPSQPGPFELVAADEEELIIVQLDEEAASPLKGHDSKRPRYDFRQDAAESANLPFEPDVPLPSKESDEGNVPTRQSQNVEKQSFAHPDHYAEVFDKVHLKMWTTIEQNGNREEMLAKTLANMPDAKLDRLSYYLGQYIESAYQRKVYDALTAMNEGRLVAKDHDSETNHHTMTLGSLFIAWINCIPLSRHGIKLEHVQTALRAVESGTQEDSEDYQSSKFSKFWTTLDSLVPACQKWKALGPSERNSDYTSRQPKGKTRRRFETPLNSVQKDAQSREHQQDEAKQALIQSRATMGLPDTDPLRKPITFNEPEIHLDTHFSRVVKDHQLRGIQFMYRETVGNMKPEGCLLAHKMGLGKTLQVIALLVTISAAGASKDPGIQMQIPIELRNSKTLILCPAALTQNWLDEFAKWTPQGHHLGIITALHSKVARGNMRFEQIQKWDKQGGVLIVGYQLFRSVIENKATAKGKCFDKSQYTRVKAWLLDGPNIVVADEAHQLRNHSSQISQVASKFRTKRRIAMTASPLSNSLMDYYWMFDWIAPHFLEDVEEFKTEFMKPIEAGSDFQSTVRERRVGLRALEQLSRILSPKIDRADLSVLKVHLPPKFEFHIASTLSAIQLEAYNLFVEAVRKGTAEGMTCNLWSWMGTLQLCCNHPSMLRQKLQKRVRDVSNTHCDFETPKISDGPTTGVMTQSILSRINTLFGQVADIAAPELSHRVSILMVIIEESIKHGDKVLVFSQSIPTLEYLATLLESQKRPYCMLTGKTPTGDRQSSVTQFNTSGVKSVFLISTRAGGVGLNIQGANRVVIFDFLFTPSCEDQAVGRAYRLGQTKPVYVYHFISGGTFEQEMHKKTKFKSELATRVVDHKNVTRAGTKASSPYLANCVNVQSVPLVCEDALMKDPVIMPVLALSQNAHMISEICMIQQTHENEELTPDERKCVEDYLFLRRLRLSDPVRHAAEMRRTSLSQVCPSLGYATLFQPAEPGSSLRMPPPPRPAATSLDPSPLPSDTFSSSGMQQWSYNSTSDGAEMDIIS